MRFYIRKDDLMKVYRGCDLGDSVGVRVYCYPHKDHLPELIHCVTAVPFMEQSADTTRNAEQACPECSTDTHDVIHTDLACSEAQDIGKKDE